MSTVKVEVVNAQGVNLTTATVATVAELEQFLQTPVCCENSIGITVITPQGSVKAGRSYAALRPDTGRPDIRIGYFHNMLDDSNEYALVLKEWQEKIKCSS
jgi:hypothetical protein